MIKNILCVLLFLLANFGFSQIPTLAIHKDDKKVDLPIHKLAIDVTIVGAISKTTFDITFYNPYDRILEGDFSFPLSEGQDVCRYALDIGSTLREGVVIEKIKARQAYEAVVRRNIDPGILSKTKGNFYKTRIYPIPEKGYKRVVFAVEQILPIINNELQYALPMSMIEEVDVFSLEVDVIKSEEKPTLISKEYSGFKFDTSSKVYQLRFNKEKYKPSKDLSFEVPLYSKTDQFTYTEMYKGQNYFYTSFKIPEFKNEVKKTSRQIGVYWDHSFSAEKRNIELELTVLKRYLEKLVGTKEVCVYTFNHTKTRDQEFKILDDASLLISYLRDIPIDGATRLDTIDFAKSYDEILFFSDGISTIGTDAVTLPKTPIYTFSSSAGSNYSTLKYIASKTNGKYLKLTEKNTDKVLEKLTSLGVTYMSCDFSTNDFKDIQVSPFAYRDGSFSIAGVLLKNEAEFTVNFGNQKGLVWSKKITIQDNTTDSAIIPRVWARYAIGELDMQYDKNKKLITELGKEHSIVTRNTSFIVLDRIEDYVTHEIVPPKELLEEYYKLLASKTKEKSKDDNVLQEQNKKRLAVLTDWYNQKIIPKNELDKTGIRRDEVRSRRRETTNQSVAPPTPAALADMIEDDVEVEEVVTAEFASEEPESVSKKRGSDKRTGPKIKLLAWQPDAPYLDSLRNATADQTVAIYHRLKKENRNTPSFYIEVADFFFKNENKKQAITVLSNLLELDLENPELLKVVARRLLDEGENELAINVYRELLELRPEEPQSYRDLALACIEDKKYQEALELFNHILNTKWNRFESIKEIVLNEINALISLHKEVLDLSEVSKELIHEMPIDVRIVVDWSSNDNDIDLWIIDPMGQKCYYQNKRTDIGGKISTDITGGYGPEEFTLKKAPRGFYNIYVNYFSESRQSIVGPVTVYATMYTNYGKKNQETKRIAVQLENGKKTVQLGQFEF